MDSDQDGVPQLAAITERSLIRGRASRLEGPTGCAWYVMSGRTAHLSNSGRVIAGGPVGWNRKRWCEFSRHHRPKSNRRKISGMLARALPRKSSAMCEGERTCMRSRVALDIGVSVHHHARPQVRTCVMSSDPAEQRKLILEVLK